MLAAAVSSPAQTARRIASIDAHQQTTLAGSRHPLTVGVPATGRMDGASRLNGVTLHFKMTAAQQADLQGLLAAQQNPSSSQYHHWLTPAQYAARFGVSDADIRTISAWLQQQGFVVQGPNISHTQLSFSGTVAQVEQAFSTQLKTYNVAGQSFFAPAQDLSLPTAVASMVHGVGNLSSLRPRAHHHPLPQFTSNVPTPNSHNVAPDDLTTIYDVKALYNGGFTGSGQTIAVVGQTAIATADLSAFRSASGLPASTPTLTLVPGSGVSTEKGGADEEESDLDVEWSGAVAKSATINFVYVGNAQNFSVFDSLQYAIDNNLAPVVSISYGGCEPSYTSGDVTTLQSWFQQANAQGQTVVAASGDSAAADCDFSTSPNTPVTSATHGPAVDLPASSPYVTGIGGTEFNGDVATPATFWSSSNNANNGSVLLYIPEETWNDTSPANGLEGGGGGVSILFGEPSWQTGTGVPSDAGRNVPDIALAASPNHDGYLYCSAGSCVNGYYNATGHLTVAGGTSFGAPIFSGILTLIEQQLASKGLGNINPTLYAIAAASPTVFHDITTGNNSVPCTAGTPGCGSSGTFGYNAGPGYDQVTGLGTPDANLLSAAFTASAGGGGAALIPTDTVLVTSTSTPTPGANITYTATVTANNGSATPGGTVQFAVDGANSGAAVALANGVATFTTSFAAVGSHTITATYSGSTTYAVSSSSLASNVAIVGGFTLSATGLTVKQGSSGTSTITVTPTGGFSGVVTITASAPATLTNSCYTATNATVTGTTAATATLTLFTQQASCTTTGSRKSLIQARAAGGRPPLTFLYAGLLPLLCLTGIRRRRSGWNSIALVVCAAGTLLWLSGCGGGGSSSSSNVTPKGTYTITVTGTNSSNSLTNTTTLSLTVN